MKFHIVHCMSAELELCVKNMETSEPIVVVGALSRYFAQYVVVFEPYWQAF